MMPAACTMGNMDLRLLCSKTCCLVRAYPPISHTLREAVKVAIAKVQCTVLFDSWMYTFELFGVQSSAKVITPANLT